MPIVQLFGLLSCKRKWHYLQQKPNILLCQWLYVTSSQSCFFFKRCNDGILKSSTINQSFSAKFLRTTLVHWNKQGFPSSGLTQNNICYHHFREHVHKGLIKIFPIATEDQITDEFTKALPQNLLQQHR